MNDNAAVHPHTNRLSQESSPYLLQHAHNPVDWYPWGPEAFEKARSENKPIFLSVGYSTCYWCHVMERQCFEVEAVAAEMNRRFVNIKVDREERPDVDQLYMTAVQVLTRHGGWPMSVFLTPDLQPFYGGTYFPPADSYGRPGFVTLLRAIEDAYKNRPLDVEKTASQIVSILQQNAEPNPPDADVSMDEALMEGLIRRSVNDYDPKNGGFGGAPKFPRETLLELLLVYLQSTGPAAAFKSSISQMLFHTLDALADGGIRDHLGGGFHRYSTDAQWLVPHFEIMLYDNAMLGWCYAEAFAQTAQPRYAEVARGIFDFILREMTSPQGLFHTALDAEVDSREGLNYLWTASEIESILGSEDARFFNKIYGVDRGPNFADPHHGSGIPDQSILFLPRPMSEVADELNMKTVALQARLAPMRAKLYVARSNRKQPLLDTKIITSWNALMIRALAHGGQVLNEPRYIDAAKKAATVLLVTHGQAGSRLYRTSREGGAKYDAFLDDYAFLTQALLSLHALEGEAHWREQAASLVACMLKEFGDSQHGGFFFTREGAEDLIVRQKTASDSPLPSGSAVAAIVLLELGHVAEARRALAVFAGQLESQGEGMSSMVQAALMHLRKAGPFTVTPGSATVNETRPLSLEQTAEGVVLWRTTWQSPTELQVHLAIERGFHINAHKVSAGLSLVPTTLTGPDNVIAAIAYPAAEELHVEFVDQPLNVYAGEVSIAVRILNAPSPGSKLKFVLVYQPCSNTACLPPVRREIEV